MSDMSRPKKTRKINHNVCNSTSIEDLDDYMLTQILIRLPSCASVLACTPVNRRWYSLISDLRFAAQFSHHKTRNANVSKSNQPKWTHLITMTDGKTYDGTGTLLYCVGNKGTNKIVFEPPKFKLKYPPYRFRVEATCMDLIVWSNSSFCRREEDPIYYVTNLITKQRFSLPPCLGIQTLCQGKPHVALVCRRLLHDYQFRVVLIDRYLQWWRTNLWVYCSEIGQWKKLKLSVQKRFQPTSECIVFNGKIYLYNNSFFAAINPFDVDDTTENDTVLDAEDLPSLKVEGVLQESSGNFFFITNPKCDAKYTTVGHLLGKANESYIEIPLEVWKLNPNHVPLKWHKTFEGTCCGNVDRVERDLGSSYMEDASYDGEIQNEYTLRCDVEMHPKDDTLMYMHISEDNLFIVCDTRSRSIKTLKCYDFGQVLSFHRFELQWWPTSLPTT